MQLRFFGSCPQGPGRSMLTADVKGIPNEFPTYKNNDDCSAGIRKNINKLVETNSVLFVILRISV
ncbi:MAG TPA: hypothetical protein VFG45_03390 [Candidatus Nitrosocosmicus sp.]|nr:hypothetical protein [Candidatus Nitrosocosmicus sp.]